MSEGAWTALSLRDPVSALTHLAACGGSVFGLLILMRLSRHDRPKQLSIACYGASMTFLYLASGLFHSLRLPPEELLFFKMLDHSAIYCLIAGTYTPIFFVLLHGRLRWNLLMVMWGMAAVGITCKWLLPQPLYAVTVGLYVAMGWVGMVALVDVKRAIGWLGLCWGVLGGAICTLGAASDLAGWPVLRPGVFGPHETLHVAVIAGSICHFLFVVRYVIPYRRLEAPAALPAVARRRAA